MPRASGSAAGSVATVLGAAAHGRLRLGLPRFAGLLVKPFAAHVLVETRADHPAAELLERPVQAIVLAKLNLDHACLQVRLAGDVLGMGRRPWPGEARGRTDCPREARGRRKIRSRRPSVKSGRAA